jgi:hypothetical protein
MRNSGATCRSRTIGLTVALVLAIASTASARNFGIQAFGGCSPCHGSASSEVFVILTGPTELFVDEQANYTIEVFETVPGGLQAGAGVNVATFFDQLFTTGVLSENDAASQILGGQLTHFVASQNSLQRFSYDFTVTAPSEPGTLELRGAMNSFNLNGNASGDKWNNTALFVPEPTPVRLACVALVTLAGLRRRMAC